MLRLFFISHGAILPRIWPQLLLFTCTAAIIVFAHRHFPDIVRGHPPGPYALLGVALSIFFSFRNNACYERWWEARIAWGQLYLAARSLARQTLILEPEASPQRRRILTLCKAYCQSLVPHLRTGASWDKAERHLTDADLSRVHSGLNRPNTLALLISQELSDLRSSGRISDFIYQTFERSLADMASVQGVCERIRNTPVPFVYDLLLQRTMFLFCLFLPFGFIDTLGWATVGATALITYTFCGLDTLGTELEHPFDALPNTLPIGAMADTIELELADAMGESNLAALPRPVNHILM